MRIDPKIKLEHKDIIPFEKRKIGEDKNGRGLYRSYINGVCTSVEDVKKKAKELLKWPNRIEPRYADSAENLKFVASMLLARKKDAADPIQITIAQNGYNNCFYYLTNKGTWNDFSYKKVLLTERSWRTEDIRKAFRHAVDDQTTDFRSRWFRVYCQGGSGYEVDHQFPHEALLQTFLNKKNIRLEEVEVEKIHNHRWSPVALKDKNLSKDWQEFHNEYCELDVKLKENNRAKIQDDIAVISTTKKLFLNEN